VRKAIENRVSKEFVKQNNEKKGTNMRVTLLKKPTCTYCPHATPDKTSYIPS
jgi:hypothetical protein